MTIDSVLRGKRILVVDDEEDILATIEDLLAGAHIVTARDYETASRKIQEESFDLAVLDIMGVNGLQLLEEAVARGIPTVMLTAHAIRPETLLESIRKGAISYLPKETLSQLDTLLSELFSAHERGEPTWKLLFERLGDFFDQRFGPGWKDKDGEFWSSFSRTYQISRGIQERLRQDPRVRERGI